MWIAIQNAVGARQGVGGGPGPTPPPYTPPLDAYTNTVVAYSVRKLSSSYSGPCMQIRRASDSTTLDIGFDSNGLVKTADIAAFCAGSVGTVSIWYDQGSLGQNATATTSIEPTIYSGTAFYYVNGYPTVRANGINVRFDDVVSHTGDWCNLFIMSSNSISSPFPTGYTIGPTSQGAVFGSNSNSFMLSSGGNVTVPGYGNIQSIHAIFSNASRLQYTRNAVGDVTAGGLSGRTYDSLLLRRDTDNASMNMQEWIMWDSDLIAAQSTLETNLNEYYQVTNLPYYTSGFLADYSGAAAAYSVRKLSNTAIKALRVRRTVAPFDELDIGFTPAGDLDEQAIVDFGGSNVLVVSRWYDQSGQSNHAVQDTPGNQPQIYNGTKVLTDMGRPTLFASADAFDITTISGLTEYTISYVARGGVGKMPAGNSNSASRTYLPWYQNASTALFRHSTVDRSVALTNPISTNQRLTFMYWDSNTVSHAVDGNTPDVSSAGYTAQPTIDRILDGYGGTLYNWDNNFQEIVIWNTDKNAASQRTAIETNVNDYFYVYNTSGFVVDYPNALTAYSVRQLGNRQRYAMRVRRLGGAADYLDVGFVSGELDTQAIIDFGGSDTLGVEVWYDQTKSGNDATNTDTTTMPIIYNGSSVITDGGKPALGRNSAGLYYSIGNIVPVGVTQASFISVVQGPDAGTLTRTWHGSGGGSLNSLTTGNNLYIYNGGSPQFGSGPAVGRTLGIQLTDGNPGAAEKGWRNGVLNYSADSGPNPPRTSALGSITLAQTPLFMQEMILYPSDIDAGGTRTNIELNIMTYYGIP